MRKRKKNQGSLLVGQDPKEVLADYRWLTAAGM
jgi:hypothetical protein